MLRDFCLPADILCGPRYFSRYSDLLRPGRPWNQTLVGRDFPNMSQTGRGAHPAACIIGTGSFSEVKWPRRAIDHPPSAEVKERVELYPCSPFWAIMACHRVNFCLFYYPQYNNLEENGPFHSLYVYLLLYFPFPLHFRRLTFRIFSFCLAFFLIFFPSP